MKTTNRKRYPASSEFLKNAYNNYAKTKNLSVNPVYIDIYKKSFLSVETQKSYYNGYSRPKEEDIDFLSHFLGFDKNALLSTYIIDNGDKNTLINDIKAEFLNMDDFSCYKLTNYFSYYKKVSYAEWDLLYNFSLLNTIDKEEFLNIIAKFKREKTLKSMLRIVEDVQLLYKIRGYSETYIRSRCKIFFESNIKDKNSSNDFLKHKLWNKLVIELKGLHINYLYLLLEQMYDITTMDYNDWTLIIYFYLYKIPNSKLSQDTNFLRILDKFLEKEEYSSISDKIKG